MSKAFSSAVLKDRLLALLTNIRRGWKGLVGTNALAYLSFFVSDKKTDIITLTLHNVIKHFTSVFYKCSY
jgi:hypothetical protein